MVGEQRLQWRERLFRASIEPQFEWRDARKVTDVGAVVERGERSDCDFCVAFQTDAHRFGIETPFFGSQQRSFDVAATIFVTRADAIERGGGCGLRIARRLAREQDHAGRNGRNLMGQVVRTAATEQRNALGNLDGVANGPP